MNLERIHRRAAQLLADVKEREEQQAYSGVVIYDPETGQPCPGYEDRAAVVRLPDNGRGVWLPKKASLPDGQP